MGSHAAGAGSAAGPAAGVCTDRLGNRAPSGTAAVSRLALVGEFGVLTRENRLVSTPTQSQRVVGRGVSTLIPQSATDQAMAALTGLETVPVHVGLLQAAALLLEEATRTAADEATKAAMAKTAGMLRSSM